MSTGHFLFDAVANLRSLVTSMTAAETSSAPTVSAAAATATGNTTPAVLAAPEPALQRGEEVWFGENRQGTVTRSYLLEDKYAVRALGAAAEVKGPNNTFFYFRRRDLRRVVPVAQQPAEISGEPLMKQAKLDEATNDVVMAEDAVEAAAGHPVTFAMPGGVRATASNGPKRFEGRIKWYSKEKGFGKIAPKDGSEEVFVHKNGMELGPDGPHATGISDGVQVTYELTTGIDGKPCAARVQVESVARAIAAIDARAPRGHRDDLLRKLLSSGLQIGSHQEKGAGKPTMEDRLMVRPGVLLDTFGENLKKVVCAFFGVFDGHSGASCSDFVANNLDRIISECLRHQNKREVASDMAMRSALQAAFRTTEHNFFQYANRLEAGPAHAWATAGSTACTATFFGPDEEGRLRLAVANAGDSRVVLGRKDGKAVRLSEDHTPDVPTERRRIEQQGSAVVNCNGIWRIVLPSRKGTGFAGLSVSRGFGDLEYKQPNPVVSAVPDVIVRTLDVREDSFIVIGSDGIWGPITDAEAVRIVALGLREGGDDPARQAAMQLVEAAHQRDPHDDKTALVVWFGDMPAVAAAVASMPQQVAAVRMKPVVVARAAAVAVATSADDMFAVGRAARPDENLPSGDLSELDDLFASFATEIGQAKRR